MYRASPLFPSPDCQLPASNSNIMTTLRLTYSHSSKFQVESSDGSSIGTFPGIRSQNAIRDWVLSHGPFAWKDIYKALFNFVSQFSPSMAQYDCLPTFCFSLPFIDLL